MQACLIPPESYALRDRISRATTADEIERALQGLPLETYLGLLDIQGPIEIPDSPLLLSYIGEYDYLYRCWLHNHREIYVKLREKCDNPNLALDDFSEGQKEELRNIVDAFLCVPEIFYGAQSIFSKFSPDQQRTLALSIFSAFEGKNSHLEHEDVLKFIQDPNFLDEIESLLEKSLQIKAETPSEMLEYFSQSFSEEEIAQVRFFLLLVFCNTFEKELVHIFLKNLTESQRSLFFAFSKELRKSDLPIVAFHKKIWIKTQLKKFVDRARVFVETVFETASSQGKSPVFIFHDFHFDRAGLTALYAFFEIFQELGYYGGISLEYSPERGDGSLLSVARNFPGLVEFLSATE